MKRLFGVLLLLSILSNQMMGQSGRIFGVIQDSISSQPLEFTTVMLYSSSDDEAIQGTTSNTEGGFAIEGVEVGKYYALFSFVGYKQKRIDNVIVDENNLDVDMAVVSLAMSQAFLKEVSIDGSRPAIEYKIDKKVISVSKQLASEGGNAIDVLESAANLRVDINGDVSLRGSKGISVLIDGKPTILSPSEALRQIPAKTIDRIEIITNPAADFDASGSAGIINIISRKDKLEGMSASASFQVGTFNEIGGDVYLKLNRKKFSTYLSVDYAKYNMPGTLSKERNTMVNDTIYKTTGIGTDDTGVLSSGLSAGIEFSPSDFDILSVDVSYRAYDYHETSDINIEESAVPGNGVRSSINSYDAQQKGNVFTVESFYKRLFAKSGHSIKASFSYDYSTGEEYPISELLLSSNDIIDGKKNYETGTADIYRFKVDYDLPIGENGEFTAGLQSKLAIYHDDTGFDAYDTINNEYEVQPNFTNQTDYLRNIHSAYSMFSSEIGKFGYQIGIRGEFTDRNIESTSVDTKYTYNKLDFFPSLHLSYDIKEETQLFASYSRRIDRPRSVWLEPFLTWNNVFNVSSGNPNLIPEYVDSYELGYLKRFDDNIFSVETYYKISDNKTESIYGVYEENVMYKTYLNIGKDYSLGAEITFGYQALEWWEFDIIGELYNYRVEGEFEGVDLSNETNSWSARFNNTFKLFKVVKFHLNSVYDGVVVDAQGKTEPYFRIDAALKTSFWDNRISASLKVRDVFDTALLEYNSEGPRFNSYYTAEYDNPSIIFSVSYNFDNQ